MKTKAHMPMTKRLLLIGMGLMIPCYLFTVGNVSLSSWPLYDRSRLALCVLTPLCVLLLLALCRMSHRIEPLLKAHGRAVLLGFAAFYFLVQMVCAQALRFVPITDAEQCFTAAQLLTDTGTYGNVERPFIYFTRYPHNLGLVYLLSGIFRFFGLFGWTDRYTQAVLVCSLLFTGGLLASAGLCRRLGGLRAQGRLLVLFALCLPFLYCTTELYTDAFSLAFPSLIIASFVRAREASSRRTQIFHALVFVLCTFIGAQIRFPSLIAAIGCLIAALFDRRVRLTLALGVPLLLAFALGGTAINRVNAAHLGAENIEKYCLPKLHYIAMGLPVQEDEGYGQYGYGGWLVFSTSFEDPKARDAALLSQVIDRVYTLRYPSRLLNMISRKNLSTFGDGTFRLNEIFEGDEHMPDNALKQVIYEGGVCFPAYQHLCTALFLAQMVLSCMACVQAIRRRETKGAALFVSLLGIFLFLCMWETRARYAFQYEMLLLCAAALLDPPYFEHYFRKFHFLLPFGRK